MMMIPLIDRHGRTVAHALVDDVDARLAECTWRLHMGRYARRADGPRRMFMHREVLGLSYGDAREVDHINHNGLDNRRSNLRLVSHSENGQNRRARGASRYRGVSLDRRYGVWTAKVAPGGRTINLGLFDSEFDAACAAARWRVEHWTHSVEDPALLNGTFADALSKRRSRRRGRQSVELAPVEDPEPRAAA
jgi:hypothetical protein